MPVLYPFRENDIPVSIIHSYRINAKSRAIYITVILSVVISLAFLPLIRIPVVVKSRGVIKLKQTQTIIAWPSDRLIPKSSSEQPFSYGLPNKGVFKAAAGPEFIAYCYIKPSDIRMIRVGQQVVFEMDGFNEEIWGLLSGKVIEISSDILVSVNEDPGFEVTCSLDKNYFELHGARMFLKQGMSFKAVFHTGTTSFIKMRSIYGDDLFQSPPASGNRHGRKS